MLHVLDDNVLWLGFNFGIVVLNLCSVISIVLFYTQDQSKDTTTAVVILCPLTLLIDLCLMIKTIYGLCTYYSEKREMKQLNEYLCSPTQLI